MIAQKLYDQIIDNMHAVITEKTAEAQAVWQEFIKAHPVDIADFLASINRHYAQALFLKLPQKKRLEVFVVLTQSMKVLVLSFLSDADRHYLVSNLPMDDLTDFLDDFSDDELSKYLKLLHKKDRERVLSLLKLKVDSVGGVMETKVLTLMADFTVEKSIQILQRLQPNRELHQQIYITNQNNELIGHIMMQDLVLRHPKTRLQALLRTNPLIAYVNQDREEVAKSMVHYRLITIPVVDEENIFLGVISAKTLIKIIEQEAGEDIYRMSALTPIKDTYFETPFQTLLYQRGSILVVLLLVQILSNKIIEHYATLLSGFLTYFITMLTSTGGNASSQTSALAIQGMATGEINSANSARFVRRELAMASILAVILTTFSFFRTYVVYRDLRGSIAVSISLFCIVLVSILLGSCMPVILKRFKFDPAHSAGPLLTTLIDVIGLFIYCVVSSLIFSYVFPVATP